MSRDKADVKAKRTCKKTDLFFSGVFILTAANIAVKAAGLLFKVPMNYIVGDTGMGYYGSAYSVYTFLYMLSTAGLPVAVSILVAESRSSGRTRQIKRIFRLALLLFLTVGILGSGLMLLFAKELSRMVGGEQSVFCMIAIAPTLLFICVSSAYRGFFQGYGHMLPIAVSQVLEAGCKLILGVGAALYSIRMGFAIHVTAAYAIAGVTVGAFLGMLCLMASKLFFRPTEDEISRDEQTLSFGEILKRFAVVSLPITLSSTVMSLSGLIDTMLIQRILLMSGVGQEEAVTMYGNYTSLAVPMFNLPPVLIYPITCALIPLLTSARTALDRKGIAGIVTAALRGTAIIGIPCAFGMAVLSHPILSLFYRETSAAEAAPLLTILAPASLFVCLLAVTNAILQSMGRSGKPVIAMLTGAIVKVVTGAVLVHRFGMVGAPISTFLCYFTAAAVNLLFVIRYTGITPDFGAVFMKPLLGGMICGLTAFTVYRVLIPLCDEIWSTVFAILVAAASYFAVIFLTKAVTWEDFNALPAARRLTEWHRRRIQKNKFQKGNLSYHE